MTNLTLQKCYQTLNLPFNATDEEIKKAYKKLALKYHPDINKNPDATKKMAELNIAYKAILNKNFTGDFQQARAQTQSKQAAQAAAQKKAQENLRRQRQYARQAYEQELAEERLINYFAKIKETANDNFYTYFQYKLYDPETREDPELKNIYQKITKNFRLIYHELSKLQNETTDAELLQHFELFQNVVFNFYKNSETVFVYQASLSNTNLLTINKLDLIINDLCLELFFNRHNRGFILKEQLLQNFRNGYFFIEQLYKLNKQSILPEIQIKEDFLKILKEYYQLFFTE